MLEVCGIRYVERTCSLTTPFSKTARILGPLFQGEGSGLSFVGVTHRYLVSLGYALVASYSADSLLPDDFQLPTLKDCSSDFQLLPRFPSQTLKD